MAVVVNSVNKYLVMKTLILLVVLSAFAFQTAKGAEVNDPLAWIGWKSVTDPWRVVEGQTNYVPRAENWFNVHGKVISVTPLGYLVSGGYWRGDLEHDRVFFFLKGLGSNLVDGDKILIRQAKYVGDQEYTTASGAKSKVRVFDYGRPCQPVLPTVSTNKPSR